MKNLTKIIIIGIFAFFGFGLFLNQTITNSSSTALAQTDVKPTPPDEAPPEDDEISNKSANADVSNQPVETVDSNSAANAAENGETDSAKVSDKKIQKEFILGTDSFSEYGEVFFDHDTHALKKYSPDGKSIVGCVECHHTDQPKSALKLPLITSERDEVLTMDVYLKSDQAVTRCRACHFQEGEVPDDKEMPVATYTEGGNETVKELNNEIAYHINCNTCHDAAAKLRPELKKKEGFATTNDCFICHKEN